LVQFVTLSSNSCIISQGTQPVAKLMNNLRSRTAIRLISQ
jgi:hypothetical protein